MQIFISAKICRIIDSLAAIARGALAGSAIYSEPESESETASVRRPMSIIGIQFNHNNEINIMKYNINTLNAFPGKQLTAFSYTIPLNISILMPNFALKAAFIRRM